MKGWAHNFKIITLMVVLCAPLHVAEAQVRTGRGGVNNDQMIEANCRATVSRLEASIRELEQFSQELLLCNESGQSYNGVNCTDLAVVEHNWDDPTNPTELQFLDNGRVVSTIAVIKGRAGANATCGNGTTPTTPTTPTDPDPDPAASCDLPWGGTIEDGQSVTAYETATVPNGQSCNSEQRECTDGSLDGDFTFEDCQEEPPGDDFTQDELESVCYEEHSYEGVGGCDLEQAWVEIRQSSGRAFCVEDRYAQNPDWCSGGYRDDWHRIINEIVRDGNGNPTTQSYCQGGCRGTGPGVAPQRECSLEIVEQECSLP